MSKELFGIYPVVNVPKVYVKDEEGNVLYTGYYIRHVNREPAPIGDKLRPEDVHHIVAYDAYADWNMPRELKMVEVTPPHRIELAE